MKNTWMSEVMGEWESYSECVFQRERVMNWLERGEINEREAQILLRLTYDYKRGDDAEHKRKAYVAY